MLMTDVRGNDDNLNFKNESLNVLLNAKIENS